MWSQERGGPIMPPDTGFPCHRLLRLSGLRWRYSNPPPNGPSQSRSPSYVTTESQSASQYWYQAPCGTTRLDYFFVTVRQLRFCRCRAPSLTRRRVCHVLRSKSLAHVIYIIQFYVSAFYLHSLSLVKESGSLWIPTIYSFTYNFSIYVRTIYTRPLSVYAWQANHVPTHVAHVTTAA
jgi:hypothetical protein